MLGIVWCVIVLDDVKVMEGRDGLGVSLLEIEVVFEKKCECENELVVLLFDIMLLSDCQDEIVWEIEVFDCDWDMFNVKIIDVVDMIKGLEIELIDIECCLCSLGENEDVVWLFLIVCWDVLVEVFVVL